MSLPLLGDGEIVDNTHELDELRHQVERLEQDNRKLRNDLIKARGESESAVAAITALRNQLNPLYRALRAVFGEITLVVDENVPEQRNSSPAASGGDAVQNLDKWEAVKKRLGGREAQLIEILLTCGPRTNSQLAPLLKCHYSKATEATKRLSNLGFIEKQGDAWALKQ